MFVQGVVENEPDFATRLLRSLDSTSAELTDPREQAHLDFRIIPMEHEFALKRPPKDNINLDGELASVLLLNLFILCCRRPS